MLYGIRRIVAGVIGWPTIDRLHVAGSFLRGSGIEIGALHNPTPVPRGARVRYVDRMSVDDLRRQYPELASARIVPVDLIDDGQTLGRVADESQDFVIANHFLEHTEDPIAAVQSAMRVLRPGGVYLLAVPDKRYTFDADRPVTSFEHLLADHADGGAGSRAAHYREVVELTEKLDGEQAEARIAEFERIDYSIHFHVWSYAEIVDLVLKLRERIGFEVELTDRQASEVVFVLRKPAAD